MRYFAIGLILLLIALPAVSASLSIFEAGDYAICIDKDLVFNDVGSLKLWPAAIGFDKTDSRDEFKYDVYELKLSTVLEDFDGSKYFGLVSTPIHIKLWRSPYNGSSLPHFVFVPEIVGNVTVGKVMKINTTLISGEVTHQGATHTPYFVQFPINDAENCEIYDPNTDEDAFRELLSGIDIISKEDLPSKMPSLWTAENLSA
jgi:hypothetical protein